MIPGYILSAFPHRQFHTLPGLLDSWAALPNSYPNACMPMQEGSLYHFYDGLWYDPAERRTHDLPCERRTRYRLSQPDTVHYCVLFLCFCVGLHGRVVGLVRRSWLLRAGVFRQHGTALLHVDLRTATEALPPV